MLSLQQTIQLNQLRELVTASLDKQVGLLQPDNKKSVKAANKTDQKDHKKSVVLPAVAQATIQDFWRTYQHAKSFFQHGFKAYLNLIRGLADEKQDAKLDSLALLMIGRTVADASGHEFSPIENEYNARHGYHRSTDPEALLKILYPQLLNNKMDFKNYYYIPVCSSRCTPIEEIISVYLKKDEKNIILIRTDDPLLVFVAIAKKPAHNETIYKRVHAILKITGMIASPWLLTLNSKIDTSDQKADSPLPKETFDKFPKSIAELKKDPLLLELIAFDKQRPTHLMAACLYSMIMGLPEAYLNKKEVQKIYSFMKKAIQLYKNNYVRFSFCVCVIIHEISLILYQAKKHKKLNFGYADYCKATKEHGTRFLGLRPEHGAVPTDVKSEDAKQTYTCVEIPANSGTNAHVMALLIARKMKTPNNLPPTLHLVGKQYFEFDALHSEFKQVGIEDADIYSMMSGPVIHELDSQPVGIDINKFFRKILNGKEALSKPIVILIDATACRYQNLKLDELLQQHVNRGDVSILVHVSDQKFRLLQTDQAQAGEGFWVLSHKSFSPEMITTIRQDAEQDLLNSLDLVIVAHISITCGKYLNPFTQQYFTNGSTYRHILSGFPDVQPCDVDQQGMSLTADDALFVTTRADSALGRVIKSGHVGVEERNSWGHFYLTVAPLVSPLSRQTGVYNLLRISPNASDGIDASIDATVLHLALIIAPSYTATVNLFLYLANQYIKKPDFSGEIILYAAIRLLNKRKHLNVREKISENLLGTIAETLDMIRLGFTKMDASHSHMFGRHHHKQLIEYAQTIRAELRSKIGEDNLELFTDRYRTSYVKGQGVYSRPRTEHIQHNPIKKMIKQQADAAKEMKIR